MVTAKEIEAKTMSEAKRAGARNDILAFYIGRPISYVCTIPFLKLNTNPNTITYWSIAFEIMGFIICCLTTKTEILILAWFMFFLWNIFDGIDGNIARFTGNCSNKGNILDALSGYLAMFLTFFATGVIAFNKQDILNHYFEHYRYLLIILGALSGFSTIFPRLIMHKIISSSKSEGAVSDVKNRANYGVVKIVLLNITSCAGGAQLFMLIAILFNLASVYTVGYFGINLLVMIISLRNMIREV